MCLVTVVMPTYNSASFFAESIDSVRLQTLEDWELIVVDDCSADDTVAKLKAYTKNDPRIKVIVLDENSGAAVARNTAIKLAKGRYIAFLDSDDRWLSYKLEKQLEFMRKNNYCLTYTAYDVVNEKDLLINHKSIPSKVKYSDLLKTNSIGCLTAMYDTHSLGKIYMPLIRKRQDLGLWLKILKNVDFAYGLNESLALYRTRKNSISSNKLSAAAYTWRLYREVEELNYLKALYYFSHYAVRGLIRSRLPKK